METQDFTAQADSFHDDLVRHKSQFADLCVERGLKKETVLQARLGLWHGMRDTRFLWGYSIPWYDESDVSVGIKVRVKSQNYDGRYLALPGSKFGLYKLYPMVGDVVVIVEGEFKALSVIQLGVCAVGSTASRFDQAWAEEIKSKFALVFVCRDNDIGGLSFVQTVKERLPCARVLAPPPEFKGIDDFIMAKGVTTLDDLITNGLKYA